MLKAPTPECGGRCVDQGGESDEGGDAEDLHVVLVYNKSRKLLAGVAFRKEYSPDGITALGWSLTIHILPFIHL